MRVAFTEVGGVRTRYYYEGSGPVLVLLHGLGIGADSWCRNIDALAEHYTVYAPDMIGHGFTGFEDLKGGAAHPKVMEHVLSLLDQLGVDTFSICGHSYGATIATLIYFERPDKVEKLILNGSHRVFQAPDRTVEGFQNSYANATSALKDPTYESCRQRMANVCYSADNIPDEILILQLTGYAQPYILPAYEQIARANMNLELSRPYRCSDRIHEVTIPVLVISGREDVRVPLDELVEGAKMLPNYELAIFDHCGHMIQAEHAEKFNEKMIEFLGR